MNHELDQFIFRPLLYGPEQAGLHFSQQRLHHQLCIGFPVVKPKPRQCLRLGIVAGGVAVPVVHLSSEEILADRFWSIEKQQAYVLPFRDAVQHLMGQGIERIHLVVAAPASLFIRMGMAYDRRLMPDLLVYQYERTALVPYP